MPKSLMHNIIKFRLAQEIKSSMDKFHGLAQINLEEIYSSLVPPPDPQMGDYAFGCFTLAKSLKRAPHLIAQEICNNLGAGEYFESYAPQGPYLNFTLATSNIAKTLFEEIESETFFNKQIKTKTPKTMLEYSQPNTHKILHVGHMRNLCLGNALVNLYRYCDYDLISATYPGDSGTHVAKCLWYLKYHCDEQIPETNKGTWLGDIYTKATTKLAQELGTNQEEVNRNQLTEILKQLEAQNGQFYDLWVETRQWSIDLMMEAYNWAHITFDKWYFESEVDSQALKYMNELHEKSLLVKDDGAIGMDLSSDKLGFCILIKSDGNSNYASKDVELARVKFNEMGIEKSLYLVDNRQSHHFKQVFKVLEKIGFKNAKNCEHLAYEMVELTSGAMSSRKGNIIPLMDLVEHMQGVIRSEHLAKYKHDWNEQQMTQTAHLIAEGAIKYGMIKMDINKKIVFDMKEWLKLEGDNGPYLQYVFARIQSLLEKQEFNPKSVCLHQVLTHPVEHRLIFKLTQFNDIVELACDQNKTSTLCSYLFETCKIFNNFYSQCSIAGADSMELKNARLHLCSVTSAILNKGLSLLGISCPKRM